MKKLLNTLAALSFTTTVASTVAACNNNTTVNMDDATSPSISDITPSKKAVMKNLKPAMIKYPVAMHKLNPSKPYSGKVVPLQPPVVTPASKIVPSASSILAKIKDPNLLLASDVNPYTNIPATVTALKTVLQADNPTLSNPDLAKLNFDVVKLDNSGSERTVIVKVSTGQGTAVVSKDLYVVVNASAVQIQAKLASFNLAIATDDTSLSAANIQKISDNLKAMNYGLSTRDISRIQYKFAGSATSFNPNNPNNLIATISSDVKGPAVTKEIIVKLYAQDQQKNADFYNFVNKINWTQDLYISGVNLNLSLANKDTQASIKQAILKANPILKASDLAYFTNMAFTIPTKHPNNQLLQNEAQNILNITVTIGDLPPETRILSAVHIYRTYQQLADLIKGIPKEWVIIRAHDNNTSNPYIKEMIKLSIAHYYKNDNWSEWDNDHISVADSVILQPLVANVVPITCTDEVGNTIVQNLFVSYEATP